MGDEAGLGELDDNGQLMIEWPAVPVELSDGASDGGYRAAALDRLPHGGLTNS
jgi:hypothetical protein